MGGRITTVNEDADAKEGTDTPKSSPRSADPSTTQSSTRAASAVRQQLLNKNAWPCIVRHNKIEEVRRLIAKGQAEQTLVEIKVLKQLFRNDEDEGETGFNFVIDENSNKLITELSRIVAEADIRWRRRADFICHQLSTYVIPPNIGLAPKKIPVPDLRFGIEELSLMGLTLHSTPAIITHLCGGCKDVLQSVVVLELAYTGIDNEEVLTLLPHMATLQKLTYLGLRGNRINKTIIPALIKNLEDRTHFKSLQRLDLRNNVDISTVPKTFLELLLQRWPPDITLPTFAQLAGGTLALEECDL